MRKASAEGVVNCLEEEVFHIFGVPEMVHSDNGKQFISITFQNFLQKYRFRHIKTVFYAPQTNAAERISRSILQTIRSYVIEDQKTRDVYLSDIAFSLRSAIHSSMPRHHSMLCLPST